MADIALQTQASTDARLSVVESFEQITLPAAETILAGAPVRINTSGHLANGNATTNAESDCYGIALNGATIRRAVTALRRGVVDGYEISALDPWSYLYLSDTDALLADAAGTIIRPVGRVIPATGVPLGTAYDRLLLVDFSMWERMFEVSDVQVLPTGQVSRYVHVFNRPAQLVAARFVFGTTEAAGTVGVTLERRQGTEAAGAGDALLDAVWDGTATVNTVQVGDLIATAATKQFAVGDRLGILHSGDTPGELAGSVMTAQFMPI